MYEDEINKQKAVIKHRPLNNFIVAGVAGIRNIFSKEDRPIGGWWHCEIFFQNGNHYGFFPKEKKDYTKLSNASIKSDKKKNQKRIFQKL